MPTYDYFCTTCNETFELRHSITDAPQKTCNQCQQPTLERKIGSGGILLFKGTGFYQTDYKQPAGKPPSAASPKAPEASSSGCGAPACQAGTCASAAAI